MSRTRSEATRFVALGVVIGLLAGAPSAARAQDTGAQVYARVARSLAFVIADLGNGQVSLGTAFCIWSTPSESYFLTNAHVVKGTSAPRLKLEFTGALASGRVVYHPTSTYESDLAVIVVGVGNVPFLTLEPDQPPVGQPIGIAGYPSLMVGLVLKQDPRTIQPSGHFGRIAATNLPGDYIEFDAKADHGNSGGPLFDAATGLVYGVVTLGVPSDTSPAVVNTLAIPAFDIHSALYIAGLPCAEVWRNSQGVVQHGACGLRR